MFGPRPIRLCFRDGQIRGYFFFQKISQQFTTSRMHFLANDDHLRRDSFRKLRAHNVVVVGDGNLIDSALLSSSDQRLDAVAVVMRIDSVAVKLDGNEGCGFYWQEYSGEVGFLCGWSGGNRAEL